MCENYSKIMQNIVKQKKFNHILWKIIKIIVYVFILLTAIYFMDFLMNGTTWVHSNSE